MDFLIQSLRAAKLREVHINQKVPIMKVRQKVPDAAQFPELSQAEEEGALLGTAYTWILKRKIGSVSSYRGQCVGVCLRSVRVQLLWPFRV